MFINQWFWLLSTVVNVCLILAKVDFHSDSDAPHDLSADTDDSVMTNEVWHDSEAKTRL